MNYELEKEGKSERPQRPSLLEHKMLTPDCSSGLPPPPAFIFLNFKLWFSFTCQFFFNLFFLCNSFVKFSILVNL